MTSRAQQVNSRIVADLGRYAEREIRKRGRKQRKRVLSPTDQLNRYLAGDEVIRLEQGDVTPEDWQRYEDHMAQMLRQRLREDSEEG